MNKGRAAIVTLGCKVNQFDSDAIADAMQRIGWELVPFGPSTDLTIINTCVVTAKAEADSRRWIRRAKRVNPRGLLLVTGCYPQIDPEAVAALGPDGVAGNQEKESIADVLAQIFDGRKPMISVGDIARAERPPDLQAIQVRRRTRAFLKIQDGCNTRCSYCIVPLARGPSRSIPPSQVLASLRSLSEAGYREVVLAGIRLGAYGLDLNPSTTLMDVLHTIAEGETPARIRLSSVEPQEVTPELMQFISSSQKVCPHLHLPLQSGADEILRRMNRPYTGESFREIVSHIHDKIPHAAIGVDVMVGFPGEDEKAFQQTYDLLHSLPISYLHVFPFSPRPGTTAADMPQQVAHRTKKEGVRVLRELSKQKRRDFYYTHKEKTLSLLVEHRRERGMLKGLSRNYISCLLEGGDELMGREVQVRLKEVEDETGVGTLTRSP